MTSETKNEIIEAIKKTLDASSDVSDSLESDAKFWREMFTRARCGCFVKDCTKHGAFEADKVTRAIEETKSA